MMGATTTDLKTAGSLQTAKAVAVVSPIDEAKDTVRATTGAAALTRYVPLLVWTIVLATLLFIPLRIISYGFLAPGDARRHVAKAFTDKPYTELIVMRPEYKMDHSPGWEWLLRAVQN